MHFSRLPVPLCMPFFVMWSTLRTSGYFSHFLISFLIFSFCCYFLTFYLTIFLNNAGPFIVCHYILFFSFQTAKQDDDCPDVRASRRLQPATD